tara:strand:- start:1052 stop:1315 length:264 start_codon:yes stop_codon:yes gene_type:complete
MSAVAENTVVSQESPVQQEQQQQEQQQQQQQPQQGQQVNLLELPVTNENEALNVMVNFLHLAQKRGSFAIAESAKIYDCVKIFQRQQ